MSDPKKHHFLPEFFLSAWKNPTMLVKYRKPIEGKVTTREVTTGMVGYADDLYRLYTETITEQRVIETKHFQELDSRAAPIIARMNKDHRDRLTDSDRFRLARFIVALPARTPWALKRARQIAHAVYANDLGGEDFARAIGLPEGMTALQALETNPHFIRDSALISAIEAHLDPKKVIALRRLQWLVIDTAAADTDLILSDNAFMLHGNLLDASVQTFIALPMGPRCLLVMHNAGLKPVTASELVRIVNRQFAKRAKEYFLARDRSHIPLAVEHLRVARGR